MRLFCIASIALSISTYAIAAESTQDAKTAVAPVADAVCTITIHHGQVAVRGCSGVKQVGSILSVDLLTAAPK